MNLLPVNPLQVINRADIIPLCIHDRALLYVQFQKCGRCHETRIHGNCITNPFKLIISYMAQHYSEKITLEDFARTASYSPNECCRVFKKYTGESIFSYLRSYRLEQSAYLLSGTKLPVTEIAYSCGFSSTSYYIEYFKRQFGMTPLKYRQQEKQI
ncbi:MAG: helix-turn-helix transcriptional regulator [Lachnospiraceae bacterium]|nr:helix-turn-helix transcriptional regulator [Lachnospiraceae bacterium]